MEFEGQQRSNISNNDLWLLNWVRRTAIKLVVKKQYKFLCTTGIQVIIKRNEGKSLCVFCIDIKRQRPLLCFSRFWPFENVARTRRVYVAYSRTKSVHTRNQSRQTQRVSAFLFWLRQMIALLYTSRGKLAARTKFHNVLWKTKGLTRMVTSKICGQKWGRSRPIWHIFALLVLNLV